MNKMKTQYAGVAEAAFLLSAGKEEVSRWRKHGRLPDTAFVLAATPVWDVKSLYEFARSAKRKFPHYEGFVPYLHRKGGKKLNARINEMPDGAHFKDKSGETFTKIGTNLIVCHHKIYRIDGNLRGQVVA